MNKDKTGYYGINLGVILLAGSLFFYEFHDVSEVFAGRKARHIVLIAGTAFIVHVIKAGRLYLALYGTGMDLRSYVKIYCKVTPVSVIFPYKAGELFRMYGYGRKLKSLLRGMVTVTLDRFMDTMALLTMMLLIWIFQGGPLSAFTYVLFLFLILILLIYMVYPGVYRFWKKCILRAKATKNRLAVLRALHFFHHVYQEIRSVSRGRGMMLYCMSLLAWGAETGSLALLGNMGAGGSVNETIAAYLSAAMGMGRSAELKQFIFVSVMMMLAAYAGIKAAERMPGKKGMQ